jgi:hypothetical protein
MTREEEQKQYLKLQRYFGKEMFDKAWSKIDGPDNRRPDPWTFPLTWLQGRLQEEWQEYAKEPEIIGKANELLDIANFCFYLYVAIITDWQKTSVPEGKQQ